MRRSLRLVGAATLIAAAFLGLSGTAFAQTDPAGDSRATSFPGNFREGHCGDNPAAAGGEDISGKVTESDDGIYVDITAVPSGYDILSVVVKGGTNGYNLYLPAKLGALPWLDLHAPLNPNGKPAGISHWVVCGKPNNTTTTTTTSGSTTTTTTKGTGTTSPTTTGASSPITTTSGAATPVTTTTTPGAVAATGSDDNLASTGFGAGWLVLVAGGLLIAGAALLSFPKIRAALLRR